MKIFEHNNWANRVLIEACSALTDEQLDAPQLPSEWTIRETLTHLVECQQNYLTLLMLPLEKRGPVAKVSFDDLQESAAASGKTLDGLARHGQRAATVRTTDGYSVEPWVVMVQVINHANDHRRQISGMLRSIGVTPPRLDGWAFGEAEGALVPVSSDA